MTKGDKPQSDKPDNAPPPKKKYRAISDRELIRLWEKDWTETEIAKAFGIQKNAISKRLSRLGLNKKRLRKRMEKKAEIQAGQRAHEHVDRMLDTYEMFARIAKNILARIEEQEENERRNKEILSRIAAALNRAGDKLPDEEEQRHKLLNMIEEVLPKLDTPQQVRANIVARLASSLHPYITSIHNIQAQFNDIRIIRGIFHAILTEIGKESPELQQRVGLRVYALYKAVTAGDSQQAIVVDTKPIAHIPAPIPEPA